MTQLASVFIEQNKMLILADDEHEIIVGSASNADRAARDRTERILRAMRPERKIRFLEMGEAELMLKAAGSGVVKAGTCSIETGDRINIGTIDAGAPAITLLNSILLEAKEMGASDIHLERFRDQTTLRLRVNGVLMPMRVFDGDTGRALTVRIKLLANLNTLETRKPQDGRFSIIAGCAEHDIRVSAVPCAGGESVALRFLDTMDSSISLANLGFSDAVYRELEKIPRLPRGLVLVTGPTGSGKTTTLAAIAKECDPGTLKIVSIEDPVEYRIPGVIQIQTNELIGLDFSAILRRVLRQDPDVILIGEIRDCATAELAVRAALTGHLVLTTLHTGSAPEAVTRLSEMNVPRYILDSVLCAVIAQRLVRTIASDGTCTGRKPVVEFFRWNGEQPGLMARSFDDEIEDLLGMNVTSQQEIKRIFGERK